VERGRRAPLAPGGAASSVAGTFFAPETPVAGSPLTLAEDAAHHARVKRVETGDYVRLVDGAGGRATGRIVRASKTQIVVDVETATTDPAPPQIHMLVPIADRDRMLWLAEKCAELGAASWRPVLWRRSRSVQGRGEGTTFQMKIRARMISALEQSGNPWLPAIFPEATVERAIAAAAAGDRLLLDAAGERLGGRSLTTPLSIVLGPEGGIEDDERDAFVAAGFAPVAVAPNVLRFETAGIAALALAVALLEA
jgi:16S rRNA (uracil1498-N3)-methyltransferase